jgi:NhaP-type Na+/H+ or K+/H+ antiporter
LELVIKLDWFLALLLVTAVVAITARRLMIPYAVGLLFAGIILSLSPFFLPPLIFEAAIRIRWEALRKALPVVLTPATLGVCLPAAVTLTKLINVSRAMGGGWATEAERPTLPATWQRIPVR